MGDYNRKLKIRTEWAEVLGVEEGWRMGLGFARRGGIGYQWRAGTRDLGAFGERFVKEYVGVEATLPNEIHAQPIRGVIGLGAGGWATGLAHLR